MSSDSTGLTTPAYESITGVVERLTYHGEESGYTVARLKTPAAKNLVTIVGNFAHIQPGQTLRLSGLWKEHPHYGLQFQVVRYSETLPATVTGLEKYLGSGLIKGVGPVTAKRIVAHFGLDTLDVIEHQIERLIEVPGIAKKRIAKIQAAWEAQKAIKEVMVFLQGHGVSTTYELCHCCCMWEKRYKAIAAVSRAISPRMVAAYPGEFFWLPTSKDRSLGTSSKAAAPNFPISIIAPLRSLSSVESNFDTLRSKETQILASDRPKPKPNGRCQDASSKSA